jgi:hypothetical protein
MSARTSTRASKFDNWRYKPSPGADLRNNVCPSELADQAVLQDSRFSAALDALVSLGGGEKSTQERSHFTGHILQQLRDGTLAGSLASAEARQQEPDVIAGLGSLLRLYTQLTQSPGGCNLPLSQVYNVSAADHPMGVDENFPSALKEKTSPRASWPTEAPAQGAPTGGAASNPPPGGEGSTCGGLGQLAAASRRQQRPRMFGRRGGLGHLQAPSGPSSRADAPLPAPSSAGGADGGGGVSRAHDRGAAALMAGLGPPPQKRLRVAVTACHAGVHSSPASFSRSSQPRSSQAGSPDVSPLGLHHYARPPQDGADGPETQKAASRARLLALHLSEVCRGARVPGAFGRSRSLVCEPFHNQPSVATGGESGARTGGARGRHRAGAAAVTALSTPKTPCLPYSPLVQSITDGTHECSAL